MQYQCSVYHTTPCVEEPKTYERYIIHSTDLDTAPGDSGSVAEHEEHANVDDSSSSKNSLRETSDALSHELASLRRSL